MLDIRIRKIDNGLLVETEYSYDICDKYNVKDATLYAMDIDHALEMVTDQLEAFADKVEDGGPSEELPF